MSDLDDITEETRLTLQLIRGRTPLVIEVVLADPKDGTGLLDLKDILVNGGAISTTRAAGTEVLNAVSHLQEALTAAIKAEP